MNKIDTIHSCYVKYAHLVHSRCMRYVQSDQEAQDLTQEVFISFMKALPFIKARESVYSWLMKTATNKCIDKIRRDQFQTELDESIPCDKGSSEKIEKTIILQDVIAHLMKPWDIKIRQTIVLSLVEGYTSQEVASLLSIGESTVRKYLADFKKRSLKWHQRIMS